MFYRQHSNYNNGILSGLCVQLLHGAFGMGLLGSQTEFLRSDMPAVQLFMGAAYPSCACAVFIYRQVQSLYGLNWQSNYSKTDSTYCKASMLYDDIVASNLLYRVYVMSSLSAKYLRRYIFNEFF